MADDFDSWEGAPAVFPVRHDKAQLYVSVFMNMKPKEGTKANLYRLAHTLMALTWKVHRTEFDEIGGLKGYFPPTGPLERYTPKDIQKAGNFLETHPLGNQADFDEAKTRLYDLLETVLPHKFSDVLKGLGSSLKPIVRDGVLKDFVDRLNLPNYVEYVQGDPAMFARFLVDKEQIPLPEMAAIRSDCLGQRIVERPQLPTHSTYWEEQAHEVVEEGKNYTKEATIIFKQFSGNFYSSAPLGQLPGYYDTFEWSSQMVAYLMEIVSKFSFYVQANRPQKLPNELLYTDDQTQFPDVSTLKGFGYNHLASYAHHWVHGERCKRTRQGLVECAALMISDYANLCIRRREGMYYTATRTVLAGLSLSLQSHRNIFYYAAIRVDISGANNNTRKDAFNKVFHPAAADPKVFEKTVNPFEKITWEDVKHLPDKITTNLM